MEFYAEVQGLILSLTSEETGMIPLFVSTGANKHLFF